MNYIKNSFTRRRWDASVWVSNDSEGKCVQFLKVFRKKSFFTTLFSYLNSTLYKAVILI